MASFRFDRRLVISGIHCRFDLLELHRGEPDILGLAGGRQRDLGLRLRSTGHPQQSNDCEHAPRSDHVRLSRMILPDYSAVRQRRAESDHEVDVRSIRG